MQTQRRTSPALMLLSSLLLSLPPTLGQAQIVFENGNVTAPQEAGTYEIKPEAGTVHGPHLEYRFSQFDLPQATDSASFTGPAPGVQNVIGLINGASHSIINGTLSCNIPDANLYLLNPNGILIGPTATVNVPGSFYAAAANSVTVDGQTFMVTGNAPIFSSIRANLADFGFIRNPGRLTVRGNINVTGSNSSANLVGDEILVQDANISPPNNFEAKGTIINVQDSIINTTNPGSTVKMEGEQVTVANSQISTVGNFEAKGTTSITVQNKSEIKTTDPGGIVKMEGDRITIEDSKVFGNSTPEDKKGIEVTGKSSVSVINSSLEGAGDAGGVENRIVNAKIEVNSADSPDVNGQVTVQGGNLVVDNSTIRSLSSKSLIQVDANDISLTNSNIRLRDNNNAKGTENAGRVTLTSEGSVTLSQQSFIKANPSGQGEGGSVVIDAKKTVKLEDASYIDNSTVVDGNAGTVRISADQKTELSKGSYIKTDSNEGQGNSGRLNIISTQVTLDNSYILARNASPNQNSMGGKVTVATNNLNLSNHSEISVQAVKDGGSGETIRGEVRIEPFLAGDDNSVSLDNSLIRATTKGGQGQGGDVNIIANQVALNNGSGISAATEETATGQAGNIQITASSGVGSVTLDNGSFIETPTKGQGQGGNIGINTNSVNLKGYSFLSASTYLTEMGGTGGNIGINANSVHLKDFSVIAAPTFGSGMGGKIDITAKDITLENNSEIAALATFKGKAQEVTIMTDTLNVKESAIAVGTTGSGEGGHLTLTAKKEATLSGQSVLPDDFATTGTGIPMFAISVDSRGTGNMSDKPTVITTPKLTLENGAVISAATFGSGHGGNLQINANNLFVTNSNIIAATGGSGEGGNIDIQTEHVELSGISSNETATKRGIANLDVSAKDIGNAGSLKIKPFQGKTPNVYLHDNATIRSATDNQGQGGNVSIQASTLELDNNSSIDAGTTSMEENAGKAGKIRIIADGTTDEGSVKILNGSSIKAKTSGEGDAQYVQIQAKKLELDTNAEISAKTEKGKGQAGNVNIFTLENEGLVSLKNNSTIEVSTESQGEGGNLTITANQLQLDNNSKVKATASAEGSAGDIEITTTTGEGAISLTNNSAIQAKAEAEGNAGHIKIHASGPLAAQDSQITTESAKSKGGDIEVDTPALAVTGASGSINASVSGQQAGGNINVNVDSLNVTDGGSIKSSTDGQGQGGNVTVNANTVVSISGQSSTLASATSNQGPAGSIQITSPQLALAQGGKIDTSSTAQGNSGRITVQTTGLSLSDQAEITAKATAEGHSGDIQVTTSTLNMNNAAKISADSRQGTGNAGSIKINTTAQKADSISLTNKSEITTKANTGAGGSIELHSRDFTLENSEINAEVISGTGSAAPATVTLDTQRLVSRNGTIESSSGGQSSAGNIAITATEYIELTGTTITSETTGSGAAGQITLGTNNAPLPSLTLTGTTISTTSKSSGDSGEINLVVNGDLNLAGSTLKSESTGGGNPNAKLANITVKSNALTLDGASVISSSTNGASPAGMITLDATSVTSSGTITSTASGSGPAGTIKIGGEQQMTSLIQDGTISTTTGGAGDGGTITINAANVTNSGTITSEAKENATGNAGNIMIGTGTKEQRVTELNVKKGSIISTTAKGTSASGDINLYVDTLTVDGEIKSEANDLGKDPKVASITVDKVGTLTMKGGKITTSTTGSRDAGGIVVTAASPNDSTVSISQGGEISSSAKKDEATKEEATGNAGEILVGVNKDKQRFDFNQVTLDTGSKIKTDAVVSNSGEIGVYARNLEVTGTSSISAENTGGRPDGQKAANINVSATESLKVKDGGKITSTTSGQNPAGTITVTAPKIDIGTTAVNGTTCTTTACGRIESSTTGSGAAGTISISASNYIEISGGGSGIFSKAEKAKTGATGNAGKITIANGNGSVESLTVSNGGQINTKADVSNSGQIEIHANTVKVSGADSSIIAVNTEGPDGATERDAANISIQANTALTLNEGGNIKSSTSGQNPAGTISIIAPKIDIGTTDTITAPKIDIGTTEGKTCTTRCGRIESSTTGSGDAGTISISASDYIKISGGESGIFSKADGPKATGNAGKITIANGNGSVESLTVSKGGKISTEANVSDSGTIDIHANTVKVSDADSSIIAVNAEGRDGATERDAANIDIQANTALTLNEGGNIKSSTSGKNPAGTITITAPKVNIGTTDIATDCTGNNCGRIESSTTGSGAAGTISISASDYIKISGEESGIFSTSGDKTEVTVAGKAGEIVLGTNDARVPTLTITARGQITTSSFKNSSGEGGNITVQANNLSLDNANILAESKGSGNAGSVNICCADSVNLKNRAGLSAKSDGTGNAGNVNVTVQGQTLLVENSEINTQQNNQGQGGNIIIDVKTGDLTIRDGGKITATVKNHGLSSKTADIQVRAKNVFLAEGKLESSTTGTSNAGDITISASEYIHLAGGVDSGIFSKSLPSPVASNKTGVRNSPSVEETKPPQDRKAGSITIYAGGTQTSPSTEFGKAEDSQIPEKVSYFKKSSGTEQEWTPNKGLELSGSSQISTSTATSGDGGTITITASQLSLTGQAKISASEDKEGDKDNAKTAGSILIGTDTFAMSNGTFITTSASDVGTDADATKEKGGGNILIGLNHVPIADPNKSSIPRISGEITASVTGGKGKGGNVEITSNNKEVFQKVFQPILKKDGSFTQNGLLFVLDKGGKITAKAAVGNGGEIKIDKAIPFAKSGDSEVSASSKFGSDGKVEIPSDVGDMGAISRLPGEPVDVSKLIKDCARKTQGQWSLRQGGRGSSKQDKEKDKEEGCKR